MPHIPTIHTESDRRPEDPYKRVLRSFHYALLCCYANFRTSYQRYDGISYIVHPGQWICPLRELRTWFRVRTNRQLLRHLDSLQRHHLIEYDLIGRRQLVQYRILDWPRYNTVLDTAPRARRILDFSSCR